MCRVFRLFLLAALASLGLTSGATEVTPRADAARGNFDVQGTSDGRTAAIREAAERIRSAAFGILLEQESPRPWLERCVIHVHATPDSFAAAVGMPPAEARGATSLEFSGDRVWSRRIDVMGDGTDVIPDALAHELVHVVLADHFVHAAPPRWADEGLAILFDDPDTQLGHEEDFREARKRGQEFSGADLLALEEYPTDGGRQRVFYGQSAALVRWLIARRDAATFIRFVGDVQTADTATALKRHYDLDSPAFLESAWKEVPTIHSLSFNNRK